MTATPSKFTVKYWAGPQDGKIEFKDAAPIKDLYLSVLDSDTIDSLEPNMEYHYYRLAVLSNSILEYRYQGIVNI